MSEHNIYDMINEHPDLQAFRARIEAHGARIIELTSKRLVVHDPRLDADTVYTATRGEDVSSLLSCAAEDLDAAYRAPTTSSAPLVQGAHATILCRVDLAALVTQIEESIATVLREKGVLFYVENDGDLLKLDGERSAKLVREMARNSAAGVALCEVDTDRMCDVCYHVDAGHTCCPPTQEDEPVVDAPTLRALHAISKGEPSGTPWTDAMLEGSKRWIPRGHDPRVGEYVTTPAPTHLPLIPRHVHEERASAAGPFAATPHDTGRRPTCFFCSAKWGACTCTWKIDEGFEFEGMIIVEPNVSECGRFYVDPFVYYGDAYRAWVEKTTGAKS